MKPQIVRFEAARSLRTRFVMSAVALLCACKSVPDASQFAAAGSQLHSAVATAGSVVTDGLEEAQLPDYAQQLNTQWQVPDDCTLAMSRYGDAIASIVKSSRDSGEAAQQVLKAGTDLASTVGIAVPPVLVSAEVAKLAGTIAQQLENFKAARALDDALSQMQPVVNNVAKLLNAQLDDVDSILTDASLTTYVALTKKYQLERGYADRLKRERQALYSAPRTADTTRQLDDIVHREQVIAPTIAAFDQEEAARQQRLNARHKLINTAKQAITNWAEGHQNLLNAVRNGGTVDLAELNESIVELRALITKARTS